MVQKITQGLSEDTKRKMIEENCIPASKRTSVVMRVKDKKAPMRSGDKAKGNRIRVKNKFFTQQIYDFAQI